MEKVYVVIESCYTGECWEDNIREIFANEEDANNAKNDLDTLENILDGKRVFLIREEEVIEGKVNVLPKKLRFCAPLKMNNNPGRVRLTVFHGEEAEAPIKFVPLKDNCFYTNSKGDFYGVIDFIPEESHQQHIERAEWLIYDKYDEIVPQWVLDSKDGHDSEHLQGSY
jgi:hypothetical protein